MTAPAKTPEPVHYWTIASERGAPAACGQDFRHPGGTTTDVPADVTCHGCLAAIGFTGTLRTEVATDPRTGEKSRGIFEYEAGECVDRYVTIVRRAILTRPAEPKEPDMNDLTPAAAVGAPAREGYPIDVETLWSQITLDTRMRLGINPRKIVRSATEVYLPIRNSFARKVIVTLNAADTYDLTYGRVKNRIDWVVLGELEGVHVESLNAALVGLVEG